MTVTPTVQPDTCRQAAYGRSLAATNSSRAAARLAEVTPRCRLPGVKRAVRLPGMLAFPLFGQSAQYQEDLVSVRMLLCVFFLQRSYL